MNRRTLLGAASWLGAAAVAVLVGLAAISIIGAGLTSTTARPLSEADVARRLDAVPTASAPASAPASPSAEASLGTPRAATRTFSTRGGTVVARCEEEGGPEIVSMSPRPGFELHDQDDDEGEFRSTSDNHDRVKFRVTCAGDQPQLTTRGDDD
ncbi:hypothetical protein [Actinoplanes sp. RD1]|uniref:hypothetical protein n=1 Tax=Actinoplanes sp. RD1 TaxID=3064538 RepID=UPI002741444E|nr:hypothetical protein [Actinoplanes sp. RD1]